MYFIRELRPNKERERRTKTVGELPLVPMEHPAEPRIKAKRTRSKRPEFNCLKTGGMIPD